MSAPQLTCVCVCVLHRTPDMLHSCGQAPSSQKLTQQSAGSTHLPAAVHHTQHIGAHDLLKLLITALKQGPVLVAVGAGVVDPACI